MLSIVSGKKRHIKERAKNGYKPSMVSGKKIWDRHIVFRAAVWTLVLRGKKSWNRRKNCYV